MDPAELREHLQRLHLERLEAESVGLTACDAYMRDLETETSECHAAYVGAVVTELAIARAEHSGRLIG
jgi:hypothetical protein